MQGYLFSLAYNVSSCDSIGKDVATVSRKHTKGCVTLECNTNIFIVCFTTAYPGLQFYDLLHALQDRCLYHDTDTVTFVSHLGDWMPLLRDCLGELTADLPPDEHIMEVVFSGPKPYGYLQSGGKCCLKVKGITLNATEKISILRH